MADVSELQAAAAGAHRRSAGWKRIAASVAVIALLGPGCATVRSVREPNFAAGQPEGLTYFLPTRLVRLTATRTPADLNGMISSRDQKVAAAAVATAQAASARLRRERAEAVLAAMLATVARRPDRVQPSDLADAQAAVQAALAEEASRTRTLQGLNEQLQGLEREIAVARTPNGACQYSAGLELLPAQADRNARFVAQLAHNYLRDDTVRLDVNPAGLLTSANVVAVDQTGQVLVEIAGALGSIAGAGGPVSAVAAEGGSPRTSCSGPPSLVRIFDPANANDVRSLNELLQQASFPFEIDVPLVRESMADGGLSNLPQARAQASGLYYRSPTPVLIELRRISYRPNHVLGDPPIITPIHGAVLMLPQAGPVSWLPMRASAFVKTTSDVQFVDGSVASWSSERPSEALSVARLPAQAIEAAVGALARVLTLRVETSTSREALGAQQVDEIVQQERNRLLLDCLARARRDNADVTPCLPEAE